MCQKNTLHNFIYQKNIFQTYFPRIFLEVIEYIRGQEYFLIKCTPWNLFI